MITLPFPTFAVSLPVFTFYSSLKTASSPPPHPEYNISAAAIAIFSLFFMILGTLCVIFSFGKGRDYLLRPAGMFFAFAGQLSHIIRITQYVYVHTNNPVFAHILKKTIFNLAGLHDCHVKQSVQSLLHPHRNSFATFA